MPKGAKPPPNPPFVPVEDPAEVKTDAVNRRVLSLFDALRQRGVSPEKAAYCISQIHARGGDGSFPTPIIIRESQPPQGKAAQ